jgi:hypothetical protein
VTQKGGSIMKEFILLVGNDIDHQAAWSPEQQQRFLNKCEQYIGNLIKEGKLKSAQPQPREGEIIPSLKGAWKDEPINAAREVIVGYYDIFAEALNDAIVIAKGNCEFEYGTTARIEVRPTKMKNRSIVYV